MRLSAVTSLFKYYPLPAALDTIAEAGYGGVEVWGGFPHAYTPDFYDGGRISAAIVEEFRTMLRASGLEGVAFLPEQCFYPVNYLVTTAPPFDAEILRQRSIDYFIDAIDVTSALQLPKMLVTTPFWGWSLQEGRMTHLGGSGHALEQVVDVLGALAQHAQTRGVTLVLEPLTYLETTAVEGLDDLVYVLDGVNSAHLVAMLDTGHVNVTAHALGKDATAYFGEHLQALGNRLQHLHISDNHGDQDAHFNPGEGNFDFKGAFDVLKYHGYAGYFSAELIMFGPNPVPPAPLERLQAARQYIEQTWNG